MNIETVKNFWNLGIEIPFMVPWPGYTETTIKKGVLNMIITFLGLLSFFYGFLYFLEM